LATVFSITWLTSILNMDSIYSSKTLVSIYQTIYTVT
jgi:hypothetical protein